MTQPDSGTQLLERTEEDTAADTPWSVLLWNDPVNLVTYVTGVLIKVLKVEKAAAERLMLLAHSEGKTAVSSGTLAECETIANQLMAYSLWATLEKS